MSNRNGVQPSEPSDAQETLLLLVGDDRNRELLATRLGDGFDVLTPDNGPPDTESFDLCLLDEGSLHQYTDPLRAAKDDASPTFLPYLLLTRQQSPDDLSSMVWNLADDVVRMPVDEAELDARIDNLVQRRRLSMELTRRKEANRRRFEALFHSTPDPVVVVTPDGTITEFNDAFQRTFGIDDGGVRGRSIVDLQFSPRESVERVLLQVTEDDEDASTATVHWDADGSHPLVAELNTDVVTGLGSAAKRIGIFRNVTERHRYERRLEKQRDKLEVLNQVLRHDIRNDVQIITGMLELLDDCVGEECAEYLDPALEQGEHVVELTETARDLARTMLETEDDQTPVSVCRAIESSIEKTHSLSGDADGDIAVEGEIPDVAVPADDMLESVFHNLLQNAIEHNDRDDPSVSISVAEADETVVVSVADNGPGVPDERKEDIFGKDEKGLESNGTGLGLYLVKTLVDQYGGDVWVEDNDPEGSIFKVELPKAMRA